MTIADVLKEMGSNSPPFQPSVNSHVDVYEERQMSWNPVCIKKDALFYQFRTLGEEECTIELLPDACLNVLFECDENDPHALFSGTFLEPKVLELKPYTTYFGFKPYSSLGLKTPGIHCGELVNAHTDFTYAFPTATQLVEKIPGAKTFDERIRMFNEYARGNLIDEEYTPTFVDYFTVMICSAKGNFLFNNMEQVTGYSERYCREKFKDTHGLSPKRYSSIMRFQNVLKSLVTNDYDDLSTLALDNGYFDQAHFIHDFKKFAAVSPYRFRKHFREVNMSHLSCRS